MTLYSAYCEECDGTYGPSDGTFRLGETESKQCAKVRCRTHDQRHHNGEKTAEVVEA